MPQIALSKTTKSSGMLLEEAIKLRRSKRANYKSKISLEELSHLLFAGQGITADKKRATPSAGMVYPLELYVMAKSVEGLASSICKYSPETHSIEIIKEGDFAEALGKACGKYVFVKDAPACIIIACQPSNIVARFGERGIRYLHMEAGSAYQNISLEAVNLGLGTVVVGAFDEKGAKEALEIKSDVLCILPIG